MTLSVERGLSVAMPDGVRLATDVFRPGGAGKWPVVVLRTPYDRGLASAYGLQVDALRLAEAGYAVVVQDVRGRFESEGEFYPFRHEGPDGMATIEWAADQRWSSGVVATVGTSYCGYAQALAARERPAGLAAAVPMFCPLDAREGWVYEGDAFALGFNLSWTIAHVAAKDRRTRKPAELLAALDAWPETVGRSPEDQPYLAATTAADYYFDWLSRRDDEAYWSELSATGVGVASPPSLVLGGWFDLFATGTFRLWGELASSPAGHRLLVGPWDHSPLPLGSSAGETEFGVAAAVDIHAMQRIWLDTHLRGENEPDWAPVRAFVTGLDAWQDWLDWPPVAETEHWFLAPGGGLDPARPPAVVEDRFVHDAGDPAPTAGGRLCCWRGWLAPGQVDQGRRAGRPDVLSYTADPAGDELLLAGPVSAEIWSGTEGAGADVFLTLVDVFPDGRALNIAEGIRRRLDAGAEPSPFLVELGHVAHVLRPGHRLRLDLAAASFPRFDRLPATGRRGRTVALGPSFLALPVVR